MQTFKDKLNEFINKSLVQVKGYNIADKFNDSTREKITLRGTIPYNCEELLNSGMNNFKDWEVTVNVEVDISKALLNQLAREKQLEYEVSNSHE